MFTTLVLLVLLLLYFRKWSNFALPKEICVVEITEVVVNNVLRKIDFYVHTID